MATLPSCPKTRIYTYMALPNQPCIYSTNKTKKTGKSKIFPGNISGGISPDVILYSFMPSTIKVLSRTRAWQAPCQHDV